MTIRPLILSITAPLLAVYAIERWPGAVRTVAAVMRGALDTVV